MFNLKHRATLKALSWTAVAASLQSCDLNTNTPSAALTTGEVTNQYMAANSVGSSNIIAGAVQSYHIATGAVGASQLDPSINFTVNGGNFSSNVAVGGTLASTGNFSVNTSEFTVAAATGNTVVGGTFTVGTALAPTAVTLYGPVTFGQSGTPETSTFNGLASIATTASSTTTAESLNVATTTTQTAAGSVFGINNTFNASPAGAASGSFFGISNILNFTTAENSTAQVAGFDEINNQNSGTMATAYGSEGLVLNSSSGVIDSAVGVLGVAKNSNSGNIGEGGSAAIGVSGQMLNTSSGNVGLAYGLDGEITNNGGATVTDAYGVHAYLTQTVGSTTTQYYGLYSGLSNAGTLTTYHALHMDDPGTGIAAGIYNLYSAGTVYNYIGGRLGIGTTTPAYGLDVASTVRFSALANDGTGDYVCINTATNEITYSTTACAASDQRLKKNIKPLEGSLANVLKLQGVTFDWKDEKRAARAGKQIGLIAQAVEKIFPDAVHLNPSGYYSMNYNALIAPVIEAVKELYAKWSDDHKRLDQSEVKLSQLEKRVELENVALKTENQRLQARLDKLEQALAQVAPSKALTPKRGRKLAQE